MINHLVEGTMVKKIKRLLMVIIIILALGFSCLVTSVSAETNRGYKGTAPQCPPGESFLFPQDCQPMPDRSGKRSFLREQYGGRKK
mgnify:CR=1 FL=1